MADNDLDPATARRIKIHLGALTRRELQIVQYSARGEPPTTVGRHFNLSARTIRAVLERISLKLGGVPLPLITAYFAAMEAAEKLGNPFPW